MPFFTGVVDPEVPSVTVRELRNGGHLVGGKADESLDLPAVAPHDRALPDLD